MNENGKVPDLFNVEAEEAIIGSILIDARILSELGHLVAADFWTVKWAWVYDAAMELHQADQPVDIVTLGDALERKGHLDEIGGGSALTGLINKNPSPGTAPGYAAIIGDLAYRRRWEQALREAGRVIYKLDDPIGWVDSQAKKVFDELRNGRSPIRPDYSGLGITLDTLMDTPYPDPVWIIPKLLPVGLSFLAGKPKVGKSWLTLQMAGAIAKGQSFFGFEPPLEVPKIAVFALEDSPKRLQNRIEKQGWYQRHLAIQFFSLRDFKTIAGDLAEQTNRDNLMLFLKDQKFGLVIIDTISRACFVDQLRNEVMAEILDPFQAFAMEENMSVQFIDHHSTKNKGDGLGPLGDILGATQKGGIADVAFGLYRTDGTEGKFSAIGRDVGELDVSCRFVRDSGLWLYQGDYWQHQETKAQKRYLDALEDEGPMTLKELAKYINVTYEAARKAIKKLQANDRVMRSTDDKGLYILKK